MWNNVFILIKVKWSQANLRKKNCTWDKDRSSARAGHSLI